MKVQTIGFIGMAALLVLIFLRVPVAVAMGIVGLVGYAAVDGWARAFRVAGQTPFDVASGYTLSVVPLFIFMGDLAMRSGMSGKLYQSAKFLFFGVRGSQALATIAACAGFGAICGSSLATAATMTRISVPEMRRSGYDDRLSTAVVAAGGTLGILIPPSIPFVIYALIAEQSVPRLFAAGLVTGLVLTALYMTVTAAVALAKPEWVPLADGTKVTRGTLHDLLSTWDVAILFGFTIGGMYAGWFTPMEAAAIGAAGALLMGTLFGQLTWEGIKDSIYSTITTTSMLFVIVIAATIFSYFVVQTQIAVYLVDLAQQWSIGPLTLIIILILFYIILGCFLDGFGMMVITVPVFLPLIINAGFDPIWFGVVLVIVIELGLIHPPVGMNIFFIQAQVPEIPVIRIYEGIVPFLAAPIVLLALLIQFPMIALWFPKLLFP